MSIRALARDLYKARQEVERLQKMLQEAPPGERDGITQELRAAQKELEILRKMLDGEKESGSFRKRFTGFGGRKL
ncbi:MAG: hypothetical protein ACD_75C01226G0005 [uncultured bacterium]|nr:MAG: hypothetical protein ACD_75C01226G0005 [uncultured bacterium]